jgi:hypothetical protein
VISEGEGVRQDSENTSGRHGVRCGHRNLVLFEPDHLGTGRESRRSDDLNTAFQQPMEDVFDIRSSGAWSYTAEASTVLATTTVARPMTDTGWTFAKGPALTPQHSAAYWEGVTAGFDFSRADQVPPGQFNRVLWAGLMGNRTYPGFRQPFFVR